MGWHGDLEINVRLGSLRRDRRPIWVDCRLCDHTGMVNPFDLPHGDHVTIGELVPQLVCSGCRNKDWRVRVDLWTMYQGPPSAKRLPECEKSPDAEAPGPV